MKDQYQNDRDSTGHLSKSKVLSNLQKQCVSPFSFQRSNNFTSTFPKLNESAMAYLGRDQFDNALLLLQKAHGVLDVVDLSGSRRDQFVAF